jgi:alpha-L-fucosidase
MRKTLFLLLMLGVLCSLQAQTISQPLPSEAQLAWHDMEFYLFIHFGPNTFTDKEWGEGTEPENIFNPTNLDCRQWCSIAKAAGAKGIIITAKHHDGFCLWPSKFSTHTVRESKWKDGKGDVLKELSEACKEYGLKFGVYLSPWDRNHPKYGTPEYNEVYVNMMKEIIENYGPIWELWWDGANGEGPNGKKQVYDWKKFRNTVRELSPNTVIFSDVGPDIRWCGNEKGIAEETNWNYLDTAGFTPGNGAPPTDTLNHGNINGKNWIPAECDVSIRPGWFYHKEEDEKVKTPQQLFQLYLKSVGRGANLLLNVPPDRRGLINEKDSTALMGFKKLRDENFQNNFSLKAKKEFHYKGVIYNQNKFADNDAETYQSALDYKRTAYWLKFDTLKKINCIVLKEFIKKGQEVKKATLYLIRGTDAVRKISLTTIGHKRIITFPAEDLSAIQFVIEDAKGTPLISEIRTYLINENLIEKL